MKKTLRQIKVVAKGEGLTQVNKEVQSLTNNLRTLDQVTTRTVAGMSLLHTNSIKLVGSLTSVGTALKKINPNKRALESYMSNMFDLTDAMDMVETQAAETSRTLGTLDFDSSGMGEFKSESNQIVDILEKILSVTEDSAIELEQLNQTTHQTSEALDGMWGSATRSNRSLEELTGTVGNLGTATRATRGNVDRQNNALRRMNGTGSSTTRGMSQMLSGMNPLTSAYASIAVNVYALSEAFRVLNEASNLNRLVEQMSNFSAGVSGLDVSSIAAQMRELSAGTLSVRESLQFATKGVAFNFTTEQLANLTEGAKKASIALGINFNDAMDRVLRGISKQEIELFDELGVVTRLDTAFSKYAAAVGKTVKELSEYERQLALTNEVQRQLDERFSGIDIAATGWEKLGVATKNSTDQGLRYLAEVLDPVAAYLAETLNTLALLEESSIISDKAVNQAKTFSEAFKQGNLGQAINATGSIEGEIAQLEKKINQYRDAIHEAKIANKEFFEQSTSSKIADILSLSSPQGLLREYAGVTKESVKTNALQENIKQSELAITKLKAQQLEQQKELAAKEGINAEFVTAENGSAVINFTKTLKNASRDLEGLAAAAREPKTPFDELIDAATKMTQTVDTVPDTVDKAKQAWRSFAKSANIDVLYFDTERFVEGIKGLRDTLRDLGATDQLEGLRIGSTANADMQKLVAQLARRKDILAKINDFGDTIDANTRRQFETEVKALELQIHNLSLKKELDSVLADHEIRSNRELLILQQSSSWESDKLRLQIDQLENHKKILIARGLETKEIEKQIALARNALQFSVIPKENREKDSANNQDKVVRLQQQQANAGDEVTRLKIQEQILSLRAEEISNMEAGITKTQAQLDLDRQREEFRKQAAAAEFVDATNLFSTLGNLEGLSDIQSIAFEVTNTFTGVFAAAEQAGQSFTDFLGSNAEAFQEFSVAIANSAGQMFSAISEGRIQSIDLEIEAERRRDGKSAESLEKIKKLEAKKIKEKQKADVAQVGMSTAVAIMNTMKDLPYPYNIVAAIATGAMGMQQISNINKAAAGQIANLNGGVSEPASVTVGGNRSNAVDVSGAASAGELAFLNGEAGTGTSSNFIPGRAGGGVVDSGSSYMTGERGPEVITPLVPSVVTPAGSNNETSKNEFNVNLQVQAIDSESFEGTIQQNAAAFWDAVESEANARGVSLNNLT